MKKIYNLMLLVAAVVFASCSDIPSPYELFDLGGTSSSAEPEGTGVYADPFNCVAANAYIENGGDENAEVYVKGIVYSIDEIDTSSFGNATYYISDDGTSKNKLEIYRGLSKNGDKFKSEEELKVGDEVIVCGKLVNFKGTFEMTQGSKIVYRNGETYGQPTVQGDPKGNGTIDDPYNPVGANNFTNTLADNGKSENNVYIKGVISKVKECSAEHGNATFYITETGATNEADFYVYRCLGLGNKPVDSDTYVKVGDEVIICGKVTKYVSQYGTTLETVQKEAYIYSLNGNVVPGEGGGNDNPPTGEARGNGTIDTPYNPIGANNFTNTLADNGKSDKDIYIKGVISKVKECSASYGNATFYITESGSTEETDFYVYRCLGLGNKPIDSDTYVKAGDEVIICGKVTKYVSQYGTTLETVQKEAYIFSLNGNTEPGNTGGNDNPGGNTGGQIDPSAGYVMSSANILSALPNITTNAYGSQLVADESTWMSWSYNNYGWKGARICKASDTNLGVQVQGNATDAAKQGFIFNTTPFPSISKVILVVSTQASSQYEPDFSLCAGNAEHLTRKVFEGTKSVETGSSYKVFTYTYDLSEYDYGYITIWNNLAGALYINTIQVITK